jgi:hypothetical protein
LDTAAAALNQVTTTTSDRDARCPAATAPLITAAWMDASAQALTRALLRVRARS